MAVNFLIKKGSDINRPDRFGATPLHYAVMSGYGKIDFDVTKAITTLMVMLDIDGINVAQKDGSSATAFENAARHVHLCNNVARVYEFLKSHPKFVNTNN